MGLSVVLLSSKLEDVTAIPIDLLVTKAAHQKFSKFQIAQQELDIL